MDSQFVRVGPLMAVTSYPQWLQEIIAACSDARHAVVAHEIFQQMHEGMLPPEIVMPAPPGAFSRSQIGRVSMVVRLTPTRMVRPPVPRL